MSYARLRIAKYLEGEHLAGGAIVDVRRLDEGGGSGVRVMRTSVPIGMMNDRLERPENIVNLDPGIYEFTAILPSGDVLSKTAEIDTRENGVPIVFDMGHSEHEWMSWQHALGNVVGKETFHMMRTRYATIPSFIKDHVTARWFSIPTVPGQVDPISMTLSDYLTHASELGERSINFPMAGHSLPVSIDSPYEMYHMPPADRFDYKSVEFERSYAIIQKTGQMLCVLPYPWRNANGKEALVELLVGPDQRLEMDQATIGPVAPWSVSTLARDEKVAPVLSYFAAGDDSAAVFLAAMGQDLLFEKMTNPFAASAGAYVLVDQWLRERGAGSGEAKWLQWIDNLARWFPWLPDGEILRGWIALAGHASAPAIESARGAFVEAENRGIPFFTAGVRHLADGLARIANQDKVDGRKDQAVVDALARIRRVASSTDPRFPFTTIRLWFDAN